MSQRKYIHDILKDNDMLASKPTPYPLPTGLKLSTDVGDLLEDPEAYRHLIGRLLYLSLTRPDLSYSIQHLSQFVSQPRLPHLQAAKHVLRYLNGTLTLGLVYPVQSSLKVTRFTDADWGSYLTTRRSLTSWKTKKQTTVSRSSAEVMAATTVELLWVSYILKDLFVPTPLHVTLFCDNRAAQQMAANPCYHECTKHLDIDCHFSREQIQAGFLQTSYIPTTLQIADVMIKALGQHRSTSFFGFQVGFARNSNLTRG